MDADVWKDRAVAAAFLTERSLHVPERRRQLEIVLRILRPTMTGRGRVLDLGAGDAVVLAALLEAFPEADGTALDFSPLMLEQARERLSRFGRRAHTAEGDLQDAAWRRAVTPPFSAVVSSLAIHHLPDARKHALYGEVLEMLAPAGVFLNIEHVASPTPRIEGFFNDAMADHLLARRREKGENATLDEVRRDYLGRADRAANILAPVEEQCRWLRELGFREVDCFWKYFELAIFGGMR